MRLATRCMPTPSSSASLRSAIAPPEPQLQHAALRLTARGWETAPLPAPDGRGTFVAVIDLRTHEVVVEASNGGVRHVALMPNRSVGMVSREVLAAIRELVGPVEINPNPQEVPWSCSPRRGRRTRTI